MANSESLSELVLSSLGSGSNGNAFLLEYRGRRILLDAGVPIRTLIAALATRGMSPGDIDAIVLSHEHSDHVRALPGLLRRSRAPVLASRGTLASLDIVANSDTADLRALVQSELFELRLTPFPVSHDAREPFGYFIETDEVNALIATDLGEVDAAVSEFASRADHIVIESNYDENLLRNGPYPAYLKQRIRSASGHLGNVECAAFLVDIFAPTTGSVWLAHLSEKNNEPELAVQSACTQLEARGYQCDIAALPRYDGRVVTWRSSERSYPTWQSSLLF